MTRTIEQNKLLYLLLNKLNIDAETKEQMVYNYTNGRTVHSSAMDREECEKLIVALQNQSKGIIADDPADKMRKKILSICHELEWEMPGGKINFERLSAWLTKYGYLHKALNEYTKEELPVLVTQFEKLLKSHYVH